MPENRHIPPPPPRTYTTEQTEQGGQKFVDTQTQTEQSFEKHKPEKRGLSPKARFGWLIAAGSVAFAIAAACLVLVFVL